MAALLILFTLIAGSVTPVQAAASSALQRAIERPATVALVSVAGSSLLTAIGAAFFGLDGLDLKLAHVPWWAWFSGAFGAVSVIAQPLAGPKIGAGAFIGLNVTTSTVASVVIDNFGWLGFEQHAASPLRIAGAAFMVVGVALVAAL